MSFFYVACIIFVAISGSHFVILYIPALATIFGVVPLTMHDWMLVMAFSFPVILIDEILKFIGRSTAPRPGEAG